MGQTCNGCSKENSSVFKEDKQDSSTQKVIGQPGLNQDQPKSSFHIKSLNQEFIGSDSHRKETKRMSTLQMRQSIVNNIVGSPIPDKKRFFSDYNTNIDNFSLYQSNLKEESVNNEKPMVQHRLKDGSVFEGELVAGVPEGHGKHIMPNGDEYIGYFRKGLRNGIGKLKTRTGLNYQGEFLNNHITGYGTLTQLNGDVYIGQVINGVYNGDGKLIKASGEVIEGTWNNGQLAS